MKMPSCVLWLIFQQLERIMTQLSELESKLTIVSEKLDKIAGDTASLLKAIEDLKTELANVTLPAGAEAKLAEVIQKATDLDDSVNSEPPV